MAVIHRKQLSAMGIHYLYYPLDYMLDAQAKAGFQTIELVGMAPHFLMDHTGFQEMCIRDRSSFLPSGAQWK